MLSTSNDERQASTEAIYLNPTEHWGWDKMGSTSQSSDLKSPATSNISVLYIAFIEKGARMVLWLKHRTGNQCLQANSLGDFWQVT